MSAAIRSFRTDPWPFLSMAERILTFEVRRSQGDPETARLLFRELERPFAEPGVDTPG